MFLAIGPWQIILILIALLIPIGIFFIGYSIGRGIGFKKGIEASKEEDL